MLHAVQDFVAFGDILADFLHQWNSVLLDAASIAAAFPVATIPVPESDPKPSPVPEPEPEPNRAPEPEPSRQPEPEPEPEPKPEPAPNRAHDREREGGDPSEAVLRLICERMGSRALRRFVTAHLRDRLWLRRVGPGALRRAPDPAALVLHAVGRYYICAESGDAEAACVLLLELYVRAGCPQRAGQGQGGLRAEAREAALSWRSRLVGEKGRVADAGARDARGLILLMAAFGVPVEFPALELYELYHAGGGLAFAEVLKCSQHFVKKMRDVVADMLNKGIYHEAIAIILAFELQDAFPIAAILTYMIEKFVHNRKDQERAGQCNLAASKGHDEAELVLLRSISKYLEDHKLCSPEISCVSIAKRIALLGECVGRPNEAFKGTKRKRTAEEDSLECTGRPKCPYASASSNASLNKNHLG